MKKFFLIFMAIFFSFAVFAQDAESPADEPNAEVSTVGSSDENENSKDAESAEIAEAENSEDAEEDVDGKKKRNRKEVLNLYMNQKGDQYIKISLMAVFPLNFGGIKGGQIKVGGSGELGYHRFLTPWFVLGADVAFGYAPTLEKNVFTYVPILVTATFQPTVWRFEFPVTIGIGFAYETYLKKHYFPGFIFKPQVGIFFKATAAWSFGLETQFFLMPQRFKKHPEDNDKGLFQTIGISARYHF